MGRRLRFDVMVVCGTRRSTMLHKIPEMQRPDRSLESTKLAAVHWTMAMIFLATCRDGFRAYVAISIRASLLVLLPMDSSQRRADNVRLTAITGPNTGSMAVVDIAFCGYPST